MNRIPAVPRTLTAAEIDAARRAIERSARQTIPATADFCLVHVACGRTIRCVAGVHSTRQGLRVIRALMKTHRVHPDDRDSTVAHVMRTRRATLRTEIHPDVPDTTRAGSIADLRRQLAPTSALVVPILHGTRVLGALSLCYAHSGRSYTSRHVASAERLAARIADVLVPAARMDAAPALRAATGHARQGTIVRRRAAPRN
jgi:GAF domain-containing protein